MATERPNFGRPGRSPTWTGRLTGTLLVLACLAALPASASAQGSEPRLLIPPSGGGAPPPAAPLVTPPASPGVTSGSSPASPPAAVAAGSPALARLDVRMTQLEQDLRTVTGRLEEVAIQLRRLDERLNKALTDMEFRLSQSRTADGETGAASATSASPRPTATPVPAEAEPGRPRPAAPPAPAAGSEGASSPPSSSGTASLSPRDQYARAFGLLEKRNYEAAAAGFSSFLQGNPNDPLADNARYWLGETYYARGEYARAAEVFLDAYEKNKTGPKAPDTLLKLGLSLSGLEKKKEACATFRELGRVFPSAPEAVKDRAAQESKRIACS